MWGIRPRFGGLRLRRVRRPPCASSAVTEWVLPDLRKRTPADVALSQTCTAASAKPGFSESQHVLLTSAGPTSCENHVLPA